MILIPILLPVLMGMLVAVVVVIAMGAVLCGTLVASAVSGGASLVSTHRSRRAEPPCGAGELTVLPGTGCVTEEGNMPEAA